MLIGIDASRALRARRTGTENYSLQLIRHLLAQGRSHHFRLYCDRPAPAGLLVPPAVAGLDGDLAVENSPAAPAELRIIPFPRLWTHLRLSLEVTRHPPDLLFVPAHALPLLHPRRSVVTVHDLGYRFFPQAHRAFDRWYLDASTRFSARTAAHVLADSQATRDDLIRIYGVDSRRISVIYLGRDEGLAPVADKERLTALQQRLGIWSEAGPRPYLLYVGTLQPRKNLVRLIEAFVQILPSCSRQWPGLCLVLAGQRGWLSEEIFRRVEQLQLQDQVIFPGFVAHEDLPALLSGALAFAFPSLYEGFGLPLLEAQACGAPTLASNTSSLPEIAGDSALLVDPLDVNAIARGLQRLLTDEALRQRLRLAGFANVQRFSWRRCAQETLVVLEDIGRRGFSRA